VTVALPGLPTEAFALGSTRMTPNALLPWNGAALLMGTEIVFGVESFSAHYNVPSTRS
jgi:hypothetical protein